ncbi:MAG: hypothetical protein [Microvirus sp.]|nr:MAG: hypothetical protein [Microvirus sp.]
MSQRTTAGIIREMALVRTANIPDTLKEKLIAQLGRELTVIAAALPEAPPLQKTPGK